ncbi:MAG: nitronate monooxygenase family protein [Candidatus Eisenbacteria bacterium]|uniref:Nitronate monooxygenase family protein n=1 Tax=Eiseniibacteriota bacterium TaxID=2212470 RepID=A0A948S015_UNCEI|nr:nitronate monooxygenase family protein [Candidatus Eisenbacteria bacterium]MBU1947924.1 nitronate monooxygenase family protein [Candidatus Eisenbacteria bacterium]MBU2692337.1 nitronate monooxygenase family protein [Candidatus Eisenbacteria bacterium]
MDVPKLQIGDLSAKIPIVQGGMGVRISLASLASAVANQGGIGTISSIGLGDHKDSEKDYEKTSREALSSEIRKAREMTDGLLAVNFMSVLSNVDDLIQTAVKDGIKIIVLGAGLPTRLPALVQDPSVNLVPIISSARVADFILRSWERRYGRIADGLILEGPLAGGHLGFSPEQLTRLEDFSIEKLLSEVLETIKPYEDRYGKKIPVITAGGIYSGKDIARMLSLGASGVQMGTRFVCTEECDASQEFKQAYLDAKEEDIVIIKSPVGMPGRAIYNKFLKDLEIKGKLKISCPYRCLTACKVKEAKYCIALALLNSYFGDVDHGLIFCGQNAHRIDKIVTVKELIKELLSELEEA